MKIKALFLFLLLCCTTNLNAQDFPFSGVYRILDQPADQAKQFDQVIVKGNTFLLLLDGEVVKNFRIVKESEAGFHVERYFPEMERQPAEKEKFIIRIDNGYEKNPDMTLIFNTGTQKVELSRISE